MNYSRLCQTFQLNLNELLKNIDSIRRKEEIKKRLVHSKLTSTRNIPIMIIIVNLQEIIFLSNEIICCSMFLFCMCIQKCHSMRIMCIFNTQNAEEDIERYSSFQSGHVELWLKKNEKLSGGDGGVFNLFSNWKYYIFFFFLDITHQKNIFFFSRLTWGHILNCFWFVLLLSMCVYPQPK